MINIYHHKYKNGIQLHHIQSNCNLFRIEIILKAGMLHENIKQLGYAHLIEHLMSFFTSKKYPNAELNQHMLNHWGMEMNAWTDENTCGYFVEGLLNYFYDVIDMVFENFVNPEFDKTIFEQEKKAVVRELSSSTDNVWYNLEHMIQCIDYYGTILEQNLFTEQENIKKAKLKDIMQFRKTLYQPSLITIIITSNHNKQQIKTICNQIETLYFKHYTYNNNIPKITKLKSQQPNTKKNCYYIKPNADTNTYCIYIHFPIPFDRFDKKCYILDYIEMLLVGGLGSRLYYALRTKLGAIYNVNVDYVLDPRNKKYNRFIIQFETNENKVIPAIDYIFLELNEIIHSKNNISNNEMKQKENIDTLQKINKECSNFFRKYAEFYEPELIWNKPITPIHEIEQYKLNITKNDIYQCAKTIFKTKLMKIFYSGNKPLLKQYQNHNIIHN